MAPFTHHIFICENERPAGHSRGCCRSRGVEMGQEGTVAGGTLKERFKSELQARGLKSQVRANTAGCLDQCELGPVVVIYPQAIWYGRVRAADVQRIVERTIQGGEILSDLLIPDEFLNIKGAKLPPHFEAARDS